MNTYKVYQVNLREGRCGFHAEKFVAAESVQNAVELALVHQQASLPKYNWYGVSCKEIERTYYNGVQPKVLLAE